ncbi:MAG TPA: LysM peptidoglycan-binding domain-containing protein [Epulopiscium sp.]|nr:LysM peptidoglycan-binding domain-containing protein [Candidatus Epulonipiscium sp.]
MIIYTVQKGDSLYDLAKTYNLNIEQVVRENGLVENPYLIEGQALIFDLERLEYTVQEGDTITSISKKFNRSPINIVRDNNLSNSNQLSVGMMLVINGQDENLGTIEVNGYIVPETPEIDTEIVNQVGMDLTYITPSNYIVNEDGTLREFDDNAVVAASTQMGIKMLMSISNAGGPGFDPERARIIISSPEIQDTLFNNVLTVMQTKGYMGLNINFEMLFPEDRQLYNEFLQNAVDFFHPYGYPVSTALVPKTYDMTTGKWWGAHDYKAQGEILDFVIVMTYDWGCGACPPMAVAPVNEMIKVLDYAVSVIPRNKILMGVPFYGFDWKLPFKNGDMAKLVDYTSALQLAAQYGSSIEFDVLAQVPYFYYFSPAGDRHVVWFEDARSFRAKYNLVDQYSLRGVSYWVLGLSAPQNWIVLRNMFLVAQ